eukprot:GILJ01015242.1.p1 GENE.GILJ01015242.1~~GILJ01015242.1.p1  ORF type:complete len:1157 (-),score=133.22 GILJ01015242.1:440-3910(-)
MQVLNKSGPSIESSTSSTISDKSNSNICSNMSSANRKRASECPLFSSTTNTLTGQVTTAPSTSGTGSYRRECSNDTHFTSSEIPTRQTTQSSDAAETASHPCRMLSDASLGSVSKKRERELHAIEVASPSGGRTEDEREEKDDDDFSPALPPPRQDSYYSNGSNHSAERQGLKDEGSPTNKVIGGSRQSSASSCCFDTAACDTAASYHQQQLEADWPLPNRYKVAAKSATTSCTVFDMASNPRIRASDEKRKKRLLRRYFTSAEEVANYQQQVPPNPRISQLTSSLSSSSNEWSDEELEEYVLNYDAEQLEGGEGSADAEGEEADDNPSDETIGESEDDDECFGHKNDETKSAKAEPAVPIKMPMEMVDSLCEVNIEKLTLFGGFDNHKEQLEKWGICARQLTNLRKNKLQWACRNLGYLCYFRELRAQRKQLLKKQKQMAMEATPISESEWALFEQELKIARAQSHFSKYLVCAETIHIPIKSSSRSSGEKVEPEETSNPQIPSFSSVFIVLPKRLPQTLKSYLEICDCSSQRQAPTLGIRMFILHQLLQAVGYLHANGFYGGCKNNVAGNQYEPLNGTHKNITLHNFDLICPKSVLITDDFQIKISAGGFGGADGVGAVGGCLMDVMSNDAGAHFNKFETSVGLRTAIYTAPEALKLPLQNDLNVFLDKKGDCVANNPVCRNPKGRTSPSITNHGVTPSPASVSSRSESATAMLSTQNEPSVGVVDTTKVDISSSSMDGEPILRANTAGPFEVEEGNKVAVLSSQPCIPSLPAMLPKPFSLHPSTLNENPSFSSEPALSDELPPAPAGPPVPPPPHASDMWSIGCIMAELITCRPIFESKCGPINALEAIIEMMGNTSDFVRREDVQKLLRRDLKCEKDGRIERNPSQPPSMNRRAGSSQSTPIVMSRSAPGSSTTELHCGYSGSAASGFPPSPPMATVKAECNNQKYGSTPTSPTTPSGIRNAVTRNDIKPTKFHTYIERTRCYKLPDEFDQHDWPIETVEALLKHEQDLLLKLLSMDAHLRPTAIEALEHPLFAEMCVLDNEEWCFNNGDSSQDDETKDIGDHANAAKSNQPVDENVAMLRVLTKHRERKFALFCDEKKENDDCTSAAAAGLFPSPDLFPFPPYLSEATDSANEAKAKEYVWKLFSRMQQLQ